MFRIREAYPLELDAQAAQPVTPQMIWLRTTDGTVRRYLLDLESSSLREVHPEQQASQQDLFVERRPSLEIPFPEHAEARLPLKKVRHLVPNGKE